ncbi:hypothetical protein BV22DRAFT_1134343 [Leucogyrophana mollusca]|uniref:Uncharacterized protein n=1 Tax=Leucogyrophana mollusca TaxID=85980 RepID=A0ACB8B0K7_9AGAM|nr:hypothetical protein BV22DRAFT_1134343 [Leucogyrophana mollusca]
MQFNGLDGLVSDSVNALSLSHGLTEARLSIDDLILLVKGSNLGSRDVIVNEFLALASEAKDASRALHNQVQGTVDTVLVMNDNLLRLLRSQHSNVCFASGYCSLVGNWLESNWLEPSYCLSSRQSISQASSYTSHAFQSAMESLISRIARLDAGLDRVEGGLDKIRDLVAAEAQGLFQAKAGVLGNLLTSLGMHRKQLARLDAQIHSLKQITSYRSIASRVVLSAHHELHDVENKVHNLHALATNPRAAENIPLETFIAAVTSGLENLRASSDEARGIATGRDRDRGSARQLGNTE